MKREEIKEILGSDNSIRENEKGTAFEIEVPGSGIDVIFTVPFDVHVIHYEAKNKEGKTLLTDLQDFYGENEESDFKEALVQILNIIRNPYFQLTNNGKTIEYGSDNGTYLFGKFSS